MITPEDVAALERVVREGGLAVFPADTVYGIACDPGSPRAIARMYELKHRERGRPSALMFFTLESALEALPGLGARTVEAIKRLLPGPITLVLPKPRERFAAAAGEGGLGVRVPRLAGALAPLAQARVTVVQTSANRSGAPDARRLSDVDPEIRDGADIVLDGGELSGLPSTVVDLTRYEQSGEWEVLRESAVRREEIESMIAP